MDTPENILNGAENKEENSHNAEAENATVNLSETDGVLADELEQLRQTFKKTLDETAAEAEAAPEIIQPLGDEPTDEDIPDDDTDEPDVNAAKPEKKKKSKGARILVSILSTLVFIIAIIFENIAVAYFTNPVLKDLGIAGALKLIFVDSLSEKSRSIEERQELIDKCTDSSSLTVFIKKKALNRQVKAYVNSESKLEANSYYQTLSENDKALVDGSLAEDIASASSASIFEAALANSADGVLNTDGFCGALSASFGTVGADSQIVKAGRDIALALNYEKECNLVEALNSYVDADTVLYELSFEDVSLYAKVVELCMKLGDISTVQSIVGTYFGEDDAVPAGFEETIATAKAFCEDLGAVSDIYSVYYSDYYSTGEPIDYEGLAADLDASSGGKYYEGIAAYLKCVVIESFEYDVDKNPLVDTMWEALSEDMPLFVGTIKLGSLTENGKYDEALELCKELLAVNCADDYLNAALSQYLRMDGDLGGALDAAKNGMSLSGQLDASAREAVICYMLDGDYATAAQILGNLMNQSSSDRDVFDLAFILETVYDGDDADLKATISNLSLTVIDNYSTNSITPYADTNAIISGEKTLEDVFMTGLCELSD